MRGDYGAQIGSSGDYTFQSTPLREGRLRCYRTDDYDKVFQSTPLREGRHKCNEWLDAADSFNPRPSVRGDAD